MTLHRLTVQFRILGRDYTGKHAFCEEVYDVTPITDECADGKWAHYKDYNGEQHMALTERIITNTNGLTIRKSTLSDHMYHVTFPSDNT